VAGLVVGAVLGFVLGSQVLRPSNAETLRAAEDLVPSGFVIEYSGVGHGFELNLLSQGESFVNARADQPVADPRMWQRLAEEEGWRVTDITDTPEDTEITARRLGGAMELHAALDAGETSIFVSVTHEDDRLLVLGPTLLGGVLGAAVGVLRSARRRDEF
jgi:hypothetical protein